MELDNKIFVPSYNKEKGLTLGFVLSVLFCSKIKNFERKIVYIFYIGNFIDLRTIERDSSLNEFLLAKIFELSGDRKYIKRKDIRELKGLTDRTTFNKYFANLGLEKKRSFTLFELYTILEFWQGKEGNWGRMKSFTKKELTVRFTNSNYDFLAEKRFCRI
ncbi:hypothetical protein ACFS5J_02465 [Flavobacterium chuncheonense]|uniref:Uncharacterized protein n=1 Tax=Flavobacterium chuncheonense TaxID=2026653 RepID=A0ABW5YII8_9FLAO